MCASTDESAVRFPCWALGWWWLAGTIQQAQPWEQCASPAPALQQALEIETAGRKRLELEACLISG